MTYPATTTEERYTHKFDGQTDDPWTYCPAAGSFERVVRYRVRDLVRAKLDPSDNPDRCYYCQSGCLTQERTEP